MAERSFGMEIRKPEIKAMKYEDFNDNEYLEKMPSVQTCMIICSAKKNPVM